MAIIIIFAIMIGTAVIGLTEQKALADFPINDVNVLRKKPVVITEIKPAVIREVTAYNSLEEQTDGSPCISADNTDICKRYQKGECIVATNAYPLKTKLYIEKIGECIVADRMNARFKNRIDVFMDKDVERAVKFGVQKLPVITL